MEPQRREIEALKHAKYEEGDNVFFIFSEEPNKLDWEREKLIARLQGKMIFYKVISPQYWKH